MQDKDLTRGGVVAVPAAAAAEEEEEEEEEKKAEMKAEANDGKEQKKEDDAEMDSGVRRHINKSIQLNCSSKCNCWSGDWHLKRLPVKRPRRLRSNCTMSWKRPSAKTMAAEVIAAAMVPLQPRRN